MVKVWQVSRLLWGMAGVGLVVGGMSVVEAQDGHTQSAAAPVAAVEIAPHPSNVSLVPMLAPTGRTAGETIVIPEAIESDEERFEDPFAMVSVPQRVGFERLRRLLPYGTTHSLLIRYLTEEERTVPRDDG